jgi:sporulation protein YhbH
VTRETFSGFSSIKRIERDKKRFDAIIRGRIKQDLRKHITRGELIGKRGREVVSIPLPQIELPHLKYGKKGMSGVGQGDGAEGTPLGQGDDEGGAGAAGDQPGAHIREVEVSIQELAELLGEELELPRIEPRGSRTIKSRRSRYKTVRSTGPESLRSFKRTYRQALKRQIASGAYDFRRPMVTPVRDDYRYRSWKEEPEPVANAVIIYMMDVSGSMGNEQKDIVRIESFWIDAWIRAHYHGIANRYIVHDAAAAEVDRETFYTTRESGGTRISSAYELAAKMIAAEYDPDEWNIYCFHFSDGDNWGGGDDDRCYDLLKERLLPTVNLFGYGQVESRYGSGQFLESLRDNVEDEKLVLSQIPNREAILDSIKEFLSKGK